MSIFTCLDTSPANLPKSETDLKTNKCGRTHLSDGRGDHVFSSTHFSVEDRRARAGLAEASGVGLLQ